MGNLVYNKLCDNFNYSINSHEDIFILFIHEIMPLDFE